MTSSLPSCVSLICSSPSPFVGTHILPRSATCSRWSTMLHCLHYFLSAWTGMGASVISCACFLYPMVAPVVFLLTTCPILFPQVSRREHAHALSSDRAAQLQWNKPQRGKVKLCSTEIQHTKACFRRTNSTHLNIKTTYFSAIGIFSRFFVFSTLEKLIYLCTGCINPGLTAPL